MDIGNRIRAARKRRGLTQEQLAHRAGLTLNALSNLERGLIHNPHLKSLLGIAASLDVPLAELIEEEPSPKAVAPKSSGREEDESRRSLYLRAVLDEARDLSTSAGEMLEWVVKFFDEVPGLPPDLSLKRANMWAGQIRTLRSFVFAKSNKWETHVLGPLSEQTLPSWERELLNQIDTQLDKAVRDVDSLAAQFSQRWSEAHPEIRAALETNPPTPEDLVSGLEAAERT